MTPSLLIPLVTCDEQRSALTDVTMTDSATLHPPTTDDIAALGQAILDDLPAEIRELVRHVPISVQDWPDDALLDSVGIEDPLALTGLYAAVPHGQRFAVGAPPSGPEMIYLFRLPILV